jgi:hypothetical protein
MMRLFTKPGPRLRSAMIAGLAIVAMTAMTGTGQALAASGGSQSGHPGSALLRLSAGATAVPALSSPGAASSCPRVFLIGARGSGETSGGAFNGLGAEVDKLLSVAASYFEQKKVSYKTYAVNYPSLSVNVLDPTDWTKGPSYYFHHNVDKYVGSIVKGRKVLIALADALHKRCGSTLMIVAGYSQGAMVAHTAVNSLPGAVLTCVQGSILLGDGNRVPNTRAKEFGTSPAKGEGIANWIASELGMSLGRDVNGWPVTANICNNYDIVCDTSLAGILHFKYAASVHTSYAKKNKNGTYTYEKVLTTAATWDAAKVYGFLTSKPGPACGLS